MTKEKVCDENDRLTAEVERLKSDNHDLRIKVANLEMELKGEPPSGKMLIDAITYKVLTDEVERLKNRKMTIAEFRDIHDQSARGDISYSRMVELVNEHFNNV